MIIQPEQGNAEGGRASGHADPVYGSIADVSRQSCSPTGSSAVKAKDSDG
jgi:hypothetical protein